MADRYVESDESKKTIYMFANILNGWAMSQSPPYDDMKLQNPSFCITKKLEDILKTPHISELDFSVECDLKYLNKKNKKWKIFRFVCLMSKKIPLDKFSD